VSLVKLLICFCCLALPFDSVVVIAISSSAEMRPAFLSYHQPSGELKYASLETANEPIFFLPNNVEDEIVLNTTVPSSKKDYAQIGWTNKVFDFSTGLT
jgi:hypothetical protein